MNVIELEHIVKDFGSLRAVDDVSFHVESGELFGLVGPNGAGKTTTIRILLDIFKPDSGRVSVLGGEMTEEKKERIGYLPEERGLYQDIRLEQVLLYLATLKGLSKAEARQRLDVYLERFDLTPHRKKKVKELSKGMQQKAQLITTFLHNPELVIIDEPFSGLDPVNTQMVKELMCEQREKGVTIVMCTHQMNQVEQLCDRLVLINEGRAVLYGRLEDIRRQFAGHEILVRAAEPLPELLPGVEMQEAQNGATMLHLNVHTSPQEVLRALVGAGVNLEKFEIVTPTLDQIFINVVQGPKKPA